MVAAGRNDEAKVFHVLASQVCEALLQVRVRPGRVVGLPASDLPYAYTKCLGEDLLGGVTSRHTG